MVYDLKNTLVFSIQFDCTIPCVRLFALIFSYLPMDLPRNQRKVKPSPKQKQKQRSPTAVRMVVENVLPTR